MIEYDYINGHIERHSGGKYKGTLTIDGVNLEGGIEGVYFTQDGKNYLWIKRTPIMEYDFDSCEYKTRKRTPFFECYLEKTTQDGIQVYKGEFIFLRFRYKILAAWDKVLGNEKMRLNFFVERLPNDQQTILKNINERKRNSQ